MATLLEKCNNIKNDKELNLKPENLKAGVTCLGVTGTLEELDTSNATATASDIADGKTAYVNGELITGNIFTVGSNANYGGMGNLTVEDDANYSRIEVKHNFGMKTLFTKDGKASFYPSYESVAEAIGLTADQILKGNTVLGIEGTAEAGDNSNIKVFNTIEEMNEITDGQEGDLAIIYGRRWTEMDPGLAFNAMEFPDTIELTELIPDWANYCYFAPAVYETENSASVIVNYDTSTITVRFRMSADAAEEIFITYTSADGLYFIADRADNRVLELPNDVMATSLDIWLLDHNKIAKINAKTADIYMFYEDYGMTGWENISNTTNSQGIDTSDATATENDILAGKIAYANGEKITGNILAYSSIDLQADNVVNWDHINTVYIASRRDDVTVVDAGGSIGMNCDYNLLASNIGLYADQIVEGHRVLGVDGTARLGYDTSDADAMAENIEPGYCAYTRDGLVWGSMNVAEGMTFDSTYDKEKPEYQIFYDEAANNIEQIYRNDNKVLLVEGTELNIRVSGTDIAEVAGITSDKIVEGNTILGIPGTATADASGPFIYRYDSENTPIAILANYHQGHLDYYDTAFFDAVLSGTKDLRYGKWLQNNRTYLSMDTSEYVLLDTFYSLLERAQAAGMNNENIVDDIFYLNGWYFSLSSGSYYESETGEILPGAMDFTDYHGGYRIAFVRTDNGIFVTDVQSLSDFTKTVDVTVKMAESNGLLSSITFNYETGVTGAECVVNNETMTQIEAWFPDNTEYTRTFLFTRDSYEFDNAEEFSAYNGNPIHYQYLSDVDAHKYVWLSNEAEGIYLSMLSKNKQTITQVGDIIERVSYTINN